MKKIFLVLLIVFLASCSNVKLLKDASPSKEKKEKIQIDESEIEVVLVQAGSNNHGAVDYDYYIGKYEVSQDKYEKIISFNPSFYKGEKLPVEQVTWYDALFFCNKLSEKEGLESYYIIKDIKRAKDNIVYASVQFNKDSKGYRLPTQTEWRYAASGGKKSMDYKYSGSNDISDVAWYKKNSGGKTNIIGTKKPNELEIFDMSGNVCEWTNREGANKRILGGTWGDFEEYSQVKDFNEDKPENKSKYAGFRIVKTK